MDLMLPSDPKYTTVPTHISTTGTFTCSQLLAPLGDYTVSESGSNLLRKQDQTLSPMTLSHLLVHYSSGSCYYWVRVTTCEMTVWSRFCSRSSFLRSHTVKASLTQEWTGRAQRGLPLAPHQAALGPDITSIAAAPPLLALCCTVRLMMLRLSDVVSCRQGRGLFIWQRHD